MARFFRWFQIVMATAVLGAVFDIGFGGCSNILGSVNPCGTILNCDPNEFDLVLHGIQTDYDLDPTCSIAGLCGENPFPISPGITTGTGVTTTTTGNTTTTGQ